MNTGRQLLQALASHTEQCSKHLYQIVLWLQGVSLLLRVQHYHHQHQKHQFTDVQRIFQQSQITANSYTLARFRQQGIVYCRVPTAQQLQRFTYIGSTKHTMTTRESTRNRKFKQITSHKIVQAELSLRWWHKHKCYHQFVLITLKTNIPDQGLEATENTFIQQHQSKLNIPFITNHMKGAFSGFTKAATNKHNGSGALWAKLRRGKIHHSIRNFADTDLFRNRKQAWQTVSHLCSNTRARFDTTRQLLRSDHFYNFRDRRQAHKALQTVFRKRRLSIPPATKPVYVQPLMHPTFRENLRQFLRTSVQDAKRNLLPFHFPSTKAVVKKHPPHTANLTQLATSPQHLAASARDRVHLRISTTQSRCTTLTQQPHRHSTCRAAATAQFPCLLRQGQRTAEEFSTGGTAHQVHQGLAKTLPHTLQQPENKGVCRAATSATRQTTANTSQHTNIKTCSATTTQGHYTLRRPLPQQTYVVLSSTLQPSNHQHLSRRASLPHLGGFSTVISLRRLCGRHHQATISGRSHSGVAFPKHTSYPSAKKHSEKDAQSLRSLTPWAENFGRPWQTFYN